MDDVTETVFRQIVADCSPPDLFFTEFVNVEALCSERGRQATIKRLVFSDKEKPLIAQIWGKNPDNFRTVANDLATMGFAGVDLNFGCPDKKVVRSGSGGGTIQYPEHAKEVIDATRDGLAGRLPLSVKTRIGMTDYDESWLKFLLEQKLDMLTVHLRTVREMSKYPARWQEHAEQIRQLRDEISPSTILVGNGDVNSRAEATALAQKYGYDGIMIGRGVFSDPYVFSSNSQWLDTDKDQKIELYQKHVRLFAQTYPNGERSFETIKKFCKVYISNFKGASELRAELMACKTTNETFQVLQKHN